MHKLNNYKFIRNSNFTVRPVCLFAVSGKPRGYKIVPHRLTLLESPSAVTFIPACDVCAAQRQPGCARVPPAACAAVTVPRKQLSQNWNTWYRNTHSTSQGVSRQQAGLGTSNWNGLWRAAWRMKDGEADPPYQQFIHSSTKGEKDEHLVLHVPQPGRVK